MVTENDKVCWTDERYVVHYGVCVAVGDFYCDVRENGADGEVWQVCKHTVEVVEE